MLALEQHAHTIQSKQITPLQRARSIGHLWHRHASRICSADQGADARPRNDRGHNSQLLEGAENADVREALQPATAKDKRDLVRFAP